MSLCAPIATPLEPILEKKEIKNARNNSSRHPIKGRQSRKATAKKKALGFDTETSGLDTHIGKCWSLQFGTRERQVLIPLNGKPRRFNLQAFIDILLDERIVKIAHNAAFDIKVLWALGLDIENIHCTRVAEALLKAGLFGDNSLAGLIYRYFDVKMSKEERKDFYCAADDKPAEERGMQSKFELSGCKWTPELIEYAVGDVAYLVPLMEAQLLKLQEEKMDNLFNRIEKPLVKVTASIERRGVKMDRESCKAYQEEMTVKADKLEKSLVYGDKNAPVGSEEYKGFDLYWKEYALSVYKKNHAIWEEWRTVWEKVKKDNNSREGRKLSEQAKAKREEYKLVQPFKTPPKPPKDINLNSSVQKQHALAQAGVFLKNTQKATLQDAAGEHPLIELLVEFSKYKKLSEMSEIYHKINPVTGRIHQTLNQNVDTGRFSSTNPNLTNIPARSDEGARFRQLFIADKGNELGVADYSAIELVIIGIRSKDKNLLHALDNDLDLHCWTMSKFLDCDYDSLVSLKDYNADKKKIPTKDQVTHILAARKRFENQFNLQELTKCDITVAGMHKWVKTFREYCKTLTYGIAYGLSAFGLSRRFHCEYEEAQRFIDVFFQVYPGIKSWLDRQSDFGERNGYSKTASGRRRYYKRPRKPERQDTIDEINRLLKQQKRDALSLSPSETNELWDQVTKRLYKEYKQTINRIRRQAANHPVQGGSADITKWAMVLYERWWVPFCKETGLDHLKLGIVLTVHDELVIEAPKKFIDTAIAKLKDCMEIAAKDFLGFTANIVVSPVKTSYWKK